MADQIIFTSAVRGVKPGASGYCTVLRSPGIRSALEQALEKISVFEHSKCNKGRLIYAYRQIDIRDKTYYALSRVGDADKDYTGRTNFLAHHLVFEKDELPELSPVDILQNWPNWCHEWHGEPREEGVAIDSFAQVQPIKPPVQTWKDQTAGVDGAINLAGDTQGVLALRSQKCSDEMLLQLLGEALAVRAKFNKSYRYAWTTSFSVGLAVVGSSKNFKWLALKASDDYVLPSSFNAMDLDAPMGAPSAVNEEMAAIARDGHFRPAPKKIPLNREQSFPIRGAQSDAHLSKGAAHPGDVKRGSRARPTGGSSRRPAKQGSKSKLVFVLCVLAILLISAAGVRFYIDKSKSAVNPNYERHYENMLKLSEECKSESFDEDKLREGVRRVFKEMYLAKNPSSEGKSLKDEEILSGIRKSDWAMRDEKINELLRFLEASPKSESVSSTTPPSKSPESAVDPDEEGAVVDEITASPDLEKTNELKPKEDLSPLNLVYDRILVIGVGETLPFTAKKLSNAKGRLVLLPGRAPALTNDTFALEDEYYTALDKDNKLFDPDSGKLLDRDDDCVLQMDVEDVGNVLLLFDSKGQKDPVQLGVLSLKKSSAKEAFAEIKDVFGLNEDFRVVGQEESLEICLIAGDGFRAVPPPKATNDKDVGASGGTPSKGPNHGIIDAMVKDSGSKKPLEDTIVNFEKWVLKQATKQLNGERDEVMKSQNSKDLDKEEKLKLGRIKKEYSNLINKMGRAKCIDDYFKAYEEKLNKLTLPESDSKDSTTNNRRLGALMHLTNIKVSPRRDQLVIEPEKGRTYTISPKNVNGSEYRWKLIYSTKKLSSKVARSNEELERSLNKYVKFINGQEERKQAQIESEVAIEKGTADGHEFNRVKRKWDLIELSHKESGKVATIKIK